MSQGVLHNTTVELKPRTGLTRQNRERIAESVANCLADSYLLFVNTQGLHWNVQGPLFYSIHKLTEEQYQDLFTAIDDLAERIRALGFPSPQSVERFQSLAEVGSLEPGATVKEMIEGLIAGNETCAQRMRKAVRAAEDAEDVKTADLLTERIGQHEENAWMLRSIIAEE